MSLSKSACTENTIFTRYLYIKSHIEVTFITSILNREKQNAMFCAFELYYSGFKNDLFHLIWSVFYDYFYIQNEHFENYLNTKSKECNYNYNCRNDIYDNDHIMNDNETIMNIVLVIENLLIRPFNCDVFVLRNLLNHYEIDVEFISKYLKSNQYTDLEKEIIELLLSNENNIVLTSIILQYSHYDDLENIYNTTLIIFKEAKHDFYANKFKKILKTKKDKKYIRYILLCKVLYHKAKQTDIIKGKKRYIKYLKEDLNSLTTIIAFPNTHEQYDMDSTKQLQIHSGIDISEQKFIPLFVYFIYQEALEKYFYKWEFYASFSPLWMERINQFCGIKNDKIKAIEFPNDDMNESFYEQYSYDPDEQTKVIHDKHIPTFVVNDNDNNDNQYSFLKYYMLYNSNNISTIENEYFEDIKSINYIFE